MKKTTYINITILLLLQLQMVKLYGQNKIELSLAQAVEVAIQNNWQVKKTEASLKVAQSELMKANATFLPNINVSETFVSTTDPLNVFGFRLKQSIVSSSDFNPVLLNDPNDFKNFTTKLNVEQPIINFDAFYGRSAAAANLKATEYGLTWTKKLISLKAKFMYYQLLLANRQKEVLVFSSNALEEGLKVTQNFYNQGLIQKVDLLEMQMRISDIETHLLAANHQIIDISSQFAHFLGYPIDTEFTLLDGILSHSIEELNYGSENSIKDRADLKAIEMQMQASNRMLSSTKFKFLPRLNAFGSYEFNDDVVFGTQANNYMVGARLEWDVFHGGKNLGEWRKMKYQHHLLQLTYDEKISESEREIQNIKNRLKVVKKQIELAYLSVLQAEESFKLKSDRYNQGLEKTAEVLKAEAVLFSKKINHLQSLNILQQLTFSLEMLLNK